MTLCSLPTEVITQIINYLLGDDLLSMHATLNHRIHSICRVPLQRWRAETGIANAYSVLKLLEYSDSSQDMAVKWDSGLPSRVFERHRSEFHPHTFWSPNPSDVTALSNSTEARIQTYLASKPGPLWLMPSDPNLQTRTSNYNTLNGVTTLPQDFVSDIDMDEFQEHVYELGLNVPWPFHHFMNSPDMQNRYHLGRKYRFCSSLTLTRIESFELSGYICKFLDDER
jgi:hypothetical protein